MSFETLLLYPSSENPIMNPTWDDLLSSIKKLDDRTLYQLYLSYSAPESPALYILGGDGKYVVGAIGFRPNVDGVVAETPRSFVTGDLFQVGGEEGQGKVCPPKQVLCFDETVRIARFVLENERLPLVGDGIDVDWVPG